MQTVGKSKPAGISALFAWGKIFYSERDFCLSKIDCYPTKMKERVIESVKKKSKYMIGFLLVAILLVSVTGCFGLASYEIMHDISEIESIHIVNNVKFDVENKKWTYDVICEVDDAQAFAKELFAIEISPIHPPAQITDQVTVVLINYHNGDYALMSCLNQRHVYIDGSSSDRPFAFDIDPYNALIEKYIKMAE